MERLPLTAALPVLLGIITLGVAADANEPTINNLILWPEHSTPSAQPTTTTSTDATNKPPVATTPLTAEGLAHVLRRDTPKTDSEHDQSQHKGGSPKFKGGGGGGGGCKSGAQSVTALETLTRFVGFAAAAAAMMVVGGMGFS